MANKDFYEINENGNIIYFLKSKVNKEYYLGEAKIHPDDIKFKSNIIGINIARDRAKLAELQDRIETLKIINSYYEKKAKETKMKLKDLKTFKNKLEISLNNYLKNISNFNFRLKKLLDKRKEKNNQ